MDVGKLIVIVLNIFIFLPPIYTKETLYSNEWLIEADITEDEARDLAVLHGFKYIKKLQTGHLLFEKRSLPRRSRLKRNFIDENIIKHDVRVRSVQRQEWKQVSLRQYAPNITDPKWPEMWYLLRTDPPSLGVLSNWQSNYTGQGVTIAIVDDGVDYDHPDLIDRYNSGISYDVYDNDGNPLPTPGHSHGTRCAGVALSSKNDICTIGVAFEAELQAIRLIGPFGVTNAGEIQALGQPAAMISSNSWGGTERTTFEGPSNIVEQAMIKGTSEFRNGKGTIYLFASGNGGFNDNCNCDGYVNSIYTIGISGVSRLLRPPGYAEPCTAILASTFSGPGGSTSPDNVCTTDLEGECISSFTGTSAATPMAAGIIALVLEANANLTWRDIQELIVRTSDSSGLQFGAFKTNSVGRQVSNYYGYGLLNAEAMTDAAMSWETLPRQQTCLTTLKSEDLQILSADSTRSVSSIVSTDGCNDTNVCVNSVEHVQVIITFEYSKRGAVTFTLQSPMGYTSDLLTKRDDDKATGSLTWTFMSVHHWGEMTEGAWNLTMSLQSDLYSSGTLKSWRLVFHGTGIGCTNEIVPCLHCTTPVTDGPSSSSNPKLGTIPLEIILPAACGGVVLLLGPSLVIWKKLKINKNKVARARDSERDNL